MKIDSIQNGIVLDHITAGKAMQIYYDLGLDKLNCSVALIQNVKSKKMGKKDIIKIDQTMDIDLDVIGYIAPEVTVSIIRDGETIEKKKVDLPKKLVNIKKCRKLYAGKLETTMREFGKAGKGKNGHTRPQKGDYQVFRDSFHVIDIMCQFAKI